MAFSQRVYVDRVPTKNGPSRECQPFDIDLLCAKLEAARLEQDAAQSQRRYRSSVGNSVDLLPVAENHRNSRAILRAESSSNLQWVEEPKKRSPSDKKSVHPRQLFTTLNVTKPRNEPVRDSAYFEALDLDVEEDTQSRRSSTGDIDVVRPHVKDRSNRQSVDVATQLKKRRSTSFPFQLSKLTPKSRPMSAHIPSYDDAPHSPMDFVNEYTISYDLADILKNEDIREPDRPVIRPQESYEKPRPLSRLRSRSMLSLNALLKRDKDTAQVQMEEVREVPDEVPDEVLDEVPETLRPLPTADAYHTRQQSLPILLGSNANTWPKTEEREKKRKSFIAFFKKF